MLLAAAQLELSLQIALAVLPVAVYFLILGLLNSQRRPQLVSARLDFSLLVACLSPLVVLPLLNWIGATGSSVTIAAAAVAGIILVLAPRGQQGWVIYNISRPEAQDAVEQALRHAGVRHERLNDGRLRLAGGVTLRMSAFSMLRNVSLRVEGSSSNSEVLSRFERCLAELLGELPAVVTPMAATFVLVATAVIVAPLVLLADHVPEMVRIISSMIQ